MRQTLSAKCAAFATTIFLALAGSAEAKLLGYWNFDGPATATPSERLKDLSGNRFHGNDRNAADATNRVKFNNADVPIAPFLEEPYNNNYSLDLTTTATGAGIAHPYVIMEGAAGIAAAQAVDSLGNAFNIGDSAAKNQNYDAGKLSVSLWYKGLPVDGWGNLVSKGGEGYGTTGLPTGTFEGWCLRKYSTSSRIAFTTRNFGLLGGGGDGDPAVDYGARSGGTIQPLFNNAVPTSHYTTNIGSGTWQHIGMVWDGTFKHWYVNGFHVRSETVTSGFAIGTQARLIFGSDINPNNGAINNARAGRVRMDEISIWNEALTPAQIEDLSRGASPLKALRTDFRPLDFAYPRGTTTAYNSFYPVTAPPANATDGNLTNAYQNAAGPYSGIIATSASSNVVQSMIITTGVSPATLDPTSYEIWGTSTAITSLDNSGGRLEGNNWAFISGGPLTLPAGRSTAGAFVAIPPSPGYLSYKVLFPTINGPRAMEIGEVQLFTSVDGTGAPLTYSSVRAVAESAVANGIAWSPSAVANAAGNEAVKNVIDGTAVKWLSYAGATSGFIVTPGNSTAMSMVLTTANDSPDRDPTSYQLFGTVDPITSKATSQGTAENWALISSGRLNLTSARNFAAPFIAFPSNTTPYTSYKVVFPTISGSILFQIADVQLYSTADGTGPGIFAPANPIIVIANAQMVPTSAGSYFGKYTGGPIIPQGSAGAMGLYEIRVNGNLRRPDSITTGTNATMYAGDSPPLYTRWGMSTLPTNAQFLAADYWIGRSVTATQIDGGDPEGLGGTQLTGGYNNYLTNRVGSADDQIMQSYQGCFQVPAAGKYTFVLKGDDGSQIAIEGTKWTAMYSNNGAGSIAGSNLQNGYPTGDTNNIAVVEFPAAGCYNFRYIWNEQGGGAFNEVFYAAGELSAYDSTVFKQVGDSAGGLTLVDHKPMVNLSTSAPTILAGLPSTATLSWDAAYATTTTLNGGIFTNTDVSAQTLNGFGSITIPAPANGRVYVASEGKLTIFSILP